MTDTMELIEKYGELMVDIYLCESFAKVGKLREKETEMISQLKSRIQAMQEVCDAAIEDDNLGLINNPYFKNKIINYKEGLK